MSKFDEKVQMYKNSAAEIGLKLSDKLITGVAKGLGPSIYLGDASLVSGTDQAELDRVKQNFLIKKLGLKDRPALDGAINEVIEQMGKSNRNKHRALVYALLAKKFGKEDMFIS
ncbi:MAG: DUF2853 family protein [Saprospiraceae bacterium]|nr:DUF2853 family protein [Saprospiraceae bacterium]